MIEVRILYHHCHRLTGHNVPKINSDGTLDVLLCNNCTGFVGEFIQSPIREDEE